MIKVKLPHFKFHWSQLLYLLVFIGILVGLFVWLSKPVHAAWFDDGYLYRLRFSFTHNAEITSARSITFTLDTAEIIAASLMQSDCDDIRFTDINGKILPHDITGTCNNASTTIEIIFPSIINGSNVGYVYYANPSAANVEIDSTAYTDLTPSGGSPSDASPTTSDEQGPGPVSYWKFDEGYGTTASDSMAANNDGTITGSTWKTDDLCVAGKCLDFDGVDDTVNLGSANSLDDINTFTWSTWVYPETSGEGGFGRIIDKSAKVLYQDGTNFVVLVSWTSGGAECKTPVTLNTWQHIVVTYTGTADCTGMKIYVNGISKTLTQTLTGTTAILTDAANDLLVGNRADGARTFDGRIDDVKVYNYARTAAQVKTDFVAGKSGKTTNSGTSASLGGNRDQVNQWMSNGLAGYWKMDEASGTRADSSGNANTLTDNNTVTSTTGKFNIAGQFTAASSEYLSITDNASVSTGNVNFTITTWVKADTLGANRAILAKWGSAGTNAQLEYQLVYVNADSRFYFEVGDGSTVGDAIATTFGAPTTGTWYFLTAQHDADNDKVYISVNAGTRDSLSWTTGVQDSTYGFSMGRAGENNFNYWNGQIDDTRIYKRLLSPSEITQLYEWGPGPLAYWKLDENTGTSNFDSSGNGNTATFTGSPTFAPGKYGSGLLPPNLDGNFSSTASPISTITTGLTMEAWVNWNITSDAGVIFYNGNSGANGYGLMINNGSGSAGNKVTVLLGGITFDVTTSSLTLTQGVWTHLTITRDGSTWRLYKDGILNSTGTTNPGTPGTGTFIIGTSAFSGTIDEAKFYNYPRTQKQIVEDMNGGHPAGGSPVSSMVGYWNFDEQQGQTLNNKGFAGSTNNGTLGANSSVASDDPTWKIPGTSTCKVNGCLSFDGSADYVNVPTLSIATDITVSLWAYSTDFTANMLMVEKETVNANWVLFFESSKLLWRGGSTTQIECNVPSNSAWHHIVGTQTGTTATLYIDGIKCAGGTVTSIGNSGGVINIGRYTTGFFFNGQLDEVKIYNSALTADEIKIDYNAGSAIAGGGVLGTQDSEGFGGNTPVAYWKMEENSGTRTDSAGSSYALTVGAGGVTSGSGKYGKAAYFPNTAGDYLTIADNADLSMGNLDFTVEAWVKLDNKNDTRIIVSKATANTTAGKEYVMNYDLTADRFVWQVSNGTTITTTNADALGSPSANTWYFIAGWYDATNDVAGISVNGALVNTSANATGSQDTAGTFQVGAIVATNHITGFIDEVKVYRYVRTTAQIAYDYNRGAPVAWYKMDECQGATANNSAPAASGDDSGNDGTITPGASGNTTVGTCNSGVSTEMWNDGTTGKRNASLGFDGTDDYVELPTAISIPNNQDLSLSAWVYADSAKTGVITQIFSGCNDPSATPDCAGADYDGVLLRKDGNDKMFFSAYYQRSGTSRCSFITTDSLPFNQWVHVAVSYDENDTTGSAVIYFNGVPKSLSTNTCSSAVSAATTLYAAIGAVKNSNNGASATYTSFWQGQIDEVRLYFYALSANQIKQIMQNGAMFFGPSQGSP